MITKIKFRLNFLIILIGLLFYAFTTNAQQVDINNVDWGVDENASNWRQDITLSRVEFVGNQLCLYSNANDILTPVPDGPNNILRGNYWIFVFHNGKWRAGTYEYFRDAQKGACVNADGVNSYGYFGGANRNPALGSNWSPTPGTTYGFMVSALARNNNDTGSNGDIRSNIVMAQWTGPSTVGGGGGGGGGGSGTGGFVGYGFPDVWINIENSGKSSQFLDELKSAGGNLTFILAVLNPDVGSPLPWNKSGGRFNLSSPNESFYNFLSGWTNKAKNRGIHTFLVMYNFWMHTSRDGWDLNPFNPNNNSNPETNCLSSSNFIRELGAAITNSTPSNSSCPDSTRAFLRNVWETFTKKLTENTPETIIFQPFSEDFKDRNFDRNAVYNQILNWWGKGKFADNVYAGESPHPAATFKDIHDSKQNFDYLQPFVIANTDDRCDPILDGRITNMAREVAKRNNASSYLVYDCEVQGSSWNSGVIQHIRNALQGQQLNPPTGSGFWGSGGGSGGGGSGGGGSGGEVTSVPLPPPPPPPPPEPPVISGFENSTIIPGDLMVIYGSNLTTNAQLKLSDGTLIPINGSVNDAKTEFSFMVPANIPDGSYTIIFSNGNHTIESSESITINNTNTPLKGTKINLDIPTEGLPQFGDLILAIFNWSLTLLGIIVFVMIFYGGFILFTAAGNPSKISEAKSQITNAIIGALILLASYMILTTINPDLVNSQKFLPKINNKNNNP
jgi:uncharacterized membrane protein YgcG